MSIKNLVKRAKITELEIEYEGKKDLIYIKPLMSGDKTDLLKHVTGLMKLKKKIDKAKEHDNDYEMTGDEIANSTIYKQKNAFYILCDKDGKREYNDFMKFVEEIPSDLMDIISDAIDKEATKDTDETDEQIEKN